jgi:hypothetical protein
MKGETMSEEKKDLTKNEKILLYALASVLGVGSSVFFHLRHDNPWFYLLIPVFLGYAFSLAHYKDLMGKSDLRRGIVLAVLAGIAFISFRIVDAKIISPLITPQYMKLGQILLLLTILFGLLSLFNITSGIPYIRKWNKRRKEEKKRIKRYENRKMFLDP